MKSDHEGRATITADVGNDRFTLAVEAEALFDGLMKYKLRLDPKAPITVKKLVLRIPMRKEIAELYHYSGGGIPAFGSLPDKKEVVIAGPFGPFL